MDTHPMVHVQLESDFLRYLFENGSQPGDRLPSLQELSAITGISIGKLREQMEVARMLGLVEASPRRGITRTAYDFRPAVRLSLLTALAQDIHYFDQFGSLRAHLEMAYWHEAVSLLTESDKTHLRDLVDAARRKLNQPRIQIPYQEHRELHLSIFQRLNNPFVLGLLEAYWDAYEAAELNTYTDYNYLCSVWEYHDRIVSAIADGEYDRGRQLLREHMQLLNSRGIAIEASTSVGAQDFSPLQATSAMGTSTIGTSTIGTSTIGTSTMDTPGSAQTLHANGASDAPQ